MNIRSLSYSLIKTLSIWIFVDLFIPSFISILVVLFDSNRDISYFSSSTITLYWIIQLFSYLILSIVLWLSANRLSLSIVKNYSDNNKTDFTIQLSDQNKILEIGLILIGFYVIVTQIANLIYSIEVFIEFLSNKVTQTNQNIDRLIQPVISITVAIYFIIGREKIIKTILKLRKVEI